MSEPLTAASDFDNDLIEDLAGFFDDPLGFVWYAYPWGEPGPLENETGPDKWQVELLETIGREIKKGNTLSGAIRIAVATGHGNGKTASIAWIIHWFMSTRDFPQIVVTASTQNQLTTKTWRELSKWHRLLINASWFEWKATKFHHVMYPETWFAAAIPWSDHNADAFAGTHEKHVLIIYDEGNAIGDKIYDTTEGALTTPGAMWLVFGNYTKNTGRFAECFAGRTRERWIRFQVDSRTAKKANQAQIKQWIEDYGEDSDFVRIRVRGIAPRAGSNQFISQDLIERCAAYRAVGFEHLPKIMTLSVARYADDQSVSGLRQGRKYAVLGKWRGAEPDFLADRFMMQIEEEEPDALIIDGDGIGGTIVDLIRRQKYDRKHGRDIMFPFFAAPVASKIAIYFNRRSEAWGEMRDAMAEGIELHSDPELTADLISPEYTFATKDGYEVIRLESKDDMRGRGMQSPENAEALAMSYSVRLAAPPRRRSPTIEDRIEAGGAGTAWMGT